ncbi:MAG TPA: hypothetical protein DD670_14460 [Planctomycetaceae bacterium]|nr:hypothetical protein [Planctomycetaceae bacterium]
MEVLVIVSFPSLQTRISEEAWEQDIIDAVSAAVHGYKTLDVVAVRALEYEDCDWIFEGGLPMPDYGVTIWQNGSWHSGAQEYSTNWEMEGDDLQSFFDYLVEKGLVKK